MTWQIESSIVWLVFQEERCGGSLVRAFHEWADALSWMTATTAEYGIGNWRLEKLVIE